MNQARYLKVFSVLAVVFALLSCNTDNSTTPPSDNNIAIRDNFFDPANLTVALGRPVVWRQMGSNNHTVTSGTPVSNPGVLFDSGILTPGSGFQFTFDAVGTYPFFCRVHGVAMTGTITVR